MGAHNSKAKLSSQSKMDKLWDQIYGDHETQVSECGEVGQQKFLIGCKKNPGHRNFIPVNRFQIKDLPKSYRDTDLYELIKAIADMTVRVDVKITSPHRPEFWPNSKNRYPLYNMRDKTNWKTGSGMMCYRVDKFTDGYNVQYGDKHRKKYTTCWCRKCKHSDTSSNVWWEFDVVTATHVVFDDIEASHTSLRLFYDRKDSPVVSVDQVSVYDANIERDRCLLTCVTCDENLADKLNKLNIHYYDVFGKVCGKYIESRDVDLLNIIVSHPHGCSKQVSVGQWVERTKVGDSYNKFTYTTCTCPGSSGARVYCVGYEGGWLYQLVHSGSLDYNLNQSGIGDVF